MAISLVGKNQKQVTIELAKALDKTGDTMIGDLKISITPTEIMGVISKTFLEDLWNLE